MNIEQANALSLSSILETINAKRVKQNGFDVWYHSPFRSDRTASFHIHTGMNVWYDFGDANGGNVVDFVCAYLKSQGEDHNPADALRWLRNMTGEIKTVPAIKEDFDHSGTALSAQKISALQHKTLRDYLASRGIPFVIAKKYLKDIYVRNLKTGKYFHALGLANEGGGYELRNKLFKGSISPKAISFIRGTEHDSGEIHVFEGMMDFLTAAIYQKGGRFKGDVIILNSVACIEQVLPYIRNHSYKNLYSWLDNDEAGEKTAKLLKVFATDCLIVFKSMNRFYTRYKDLNEWHMSRVRSKPPAQRI